MKWLDDKPTVPAQCFVCGEELAQRSGAAAYRQTTWVDDVNGARTVWRDVWFCSQECYERELMR